MKHDDQAIDALRRVGLFARLDDKKLGRIAAQTKTYKFGPGDSVIDADSSGRFGRLYTVISGSADAKVDGRTVATFGAGDYFGEMSVLDGSPRSASIVATTDLETFGLSAWNMRSLLREEPEIALHVIETLAARLRAKNIATSD